MMSRGYYINFKDFARYSKYVNNSSAKIERKNKQKRMTPLQKMLFCRSIYYDSIFTSKSNISDYRPFLAQQKNPDKKKNFLEHFESYNPVNLMDRVFAPIYRKVLYTNYNLKASFKSI
jgi:hypothetical protein